MKTTHLPRVNRVLAAMLLASLPLLTHAAEQLRYHNDNRQTVKMIVGANAAVATAKGEALARAFLRDHAGQFGLPANLANLQRVKTRESLTANHYFYQQVLNSVPVLTGEVIVSINKNTGRVSRAYNNTYPSHDTVVNNTATKSATPALTREQALAKAWDYLQGAGELMLAPQSKLYYVNMGDQLVLAYQTHLQATKTPGSWEHIVDAHTGEILRARRVELPSKRAANPVSVGDRWPAAAADPAHRSFAEVMSAYQQAEAGKAASKAAQNAAVSLLADGSAQVFDPDPRTTLNNANLQDANVIPSGAYQTRILRGITFTGATHTLVGPWVNITDISAPATLPSTNPTGEWTDIRGSNAFNDVNTYFHIDQNQRYIQSLGFNSPMTGRAAQFNSIAADSDALNGQDQSQFNPTGNSLEFGHGCVDDNEDADVILHEYGHALQWDINNNWTGGDTGAMGEGFGDYWAGSYSYSTPNGGTFNPALMFTWDGPGCWDGRRMDRTSDQYDPGTSYGAHQMVGSVLSDELWSTPLFQSLVELISLGVPREQVDQIVLEAHFGLGANVTMPEMALAILQAATDLYPAGQHRAVFLSKFQQVNILGAAANRLPVAKVSQASISVATGGSVSMSAATSTDADSDPLTYGWTQISGATVMLTGANMAQASFTAPTSSGSLVFRVTVADGKGGSDTADVTVTVTKSSSGGGGGPFGALGVMALAALAGWRRVRR